MLTNAPLGVCYKQGMGMTEKLCHESPDIIGKTLLAKAAIDWYIQGIVIVELRFGFFVPDLK